MNKISQFFKGIGTFLGEVRSELKKCAWPTRSELMESTLVVIICVIIMGVFVGISDALLAGFLNLIVR